MPSMKTSAPLPPNSPQVLEPVQLKVSGKLPAWLKGTLYRAGQGTFEIPFPDSHETFKVNHPFDGLAQMHRFQFDGATQTVLYNSRDTAKGYEKRILARDSSLIYFGPDPCKTIFKRMFTFAHLLGGPDSSSSDASVKDPSSANINVTITPNFPIPGTFGVGSANLVVKTDYNAIQVLDPVTLEPKKLTDYSAYDPAILGQVSAAHHQQDAETHEYFNFALDMGRKIQYTVFSVDPTGAPTLFKPVIKNLGSALPLVPSYIHAFSLTDRYLILPTYPYYMSFHGLGLLWYGNIVEGLKWDGDRPTMLQVLDRKTRQHVATFEAKPYFAFHTLNAWDEGSDVVFEVMAYPDASVVENSYRLFRETGSVEPEGLTPTPKSPSSEVRRYRLKDVAGVAAAQARDARHQARAEYDVVGGDIEMGRFNPLYERKKSRYAWGISRSPAAAEQVTSSNGLAKVDTETGESTVWYVPATSAGEPVFVPTPGATDEDDGVLLTIVNSSTAQRRCFMVILDARSMTELARAEIGKRTTVTLHGSFVDDTGRSVAIN